MKRRVARIAIGLAVALTVALAQAQITLRDDRGATLQFAAPPQRIVSLLPSLTESVCALGACARIVGTDNFSNFPPSVRSLPKLGGIDDAQIERIVALKPDVVLVSGSTRITERLEALGQKVLVLESRDHADVQRTLRLVATLLGSAALAAPLEAAIDLQMRAAAARVPASLRGRLVYFEVDATPYAAGPTSFIGETLTRLGMGNALAAQLGPFPRLNPEAVVRLQPDIVMADERNLADMPARPGWTALRALQQRRSCGFPSARYELLIRPGPRMGEAAGVLADCLQGLGLSTAHEVSPR